MKLIRKTVLNLSLTGLKGTKTSRTMVKLLIEEAIKRALVLKIEYVDKGGNVSIREIEPLEWDTNMVHARCRLRKDIRQFQYSHITSASWTGDVFDPNDNSLLEEGGRKALNAMRLKSPLGPV